MTVKRIDNPINRLRVAWDPTLFQETAEDFDRHAGEAIAAAKSGQPGQCPQCSRSGAERKGCNCTVQRCPVIDIFTRRRVR